MAYQIVLYGNNAKSAMCLNYIRPRNLRKDLPYTFNLRDYKIKSLSYWMVHCLALQIVKKSLVMSRAMGVVDLARDVPISYTFEEPCTYTVSLRVIDDILS